MRPRDGRAAPAPRGPRLLTGEAKYVGDLAVPGALHVALVRSPFAHARIRSVDTAAAAALPGVVAVFTGADLQDEWANPMPCAWPVTDDMKSPAHLPRRGRQGVLRGRRGSRHRGRVLVPGRDARPRSSSTTTRSLRWSTWRRVVRPGGHPRRLRTNRSYTWELIPTPTRSSRPSGPRPTPSGSATCSSD